MNYRLSADELAIVDNLMTGDAFNKRTLLEGGTGQRVGLMAELAFKRLLKDKFPEVKYVGHQSYEYDFEINGLTIDVKAKKRTVSCQSNYECHVNQYQQKSNVDYYVFASVVDDLVEFMGYESKPNFWRKCRIVEEGDYTGIQERATSGKMFYSQLRSFDDFVDNIELYLYRKAFGEI